jgi:hypothetical protein
VRLAGRRDDHGDWRLVVVVEYNDNDQRAVDVEAELGLGGDDITQAARFAAREAIRGGKMDAALLRAAAEVLQRAMIGRMMEAAKESATAG